MDKTKTRLVSLANYLPRHFILWIGYGPTVGLQMILYPTSTTVHYSPQVRQDDLECLHILKGMTSKLLAATPDSHEHLFTTVASDLEVRVTIVLLQLLDF